MFSFIPLSDHTNCSISQDWSSEERQNTVARPTVQIAGEKYVFGDEYFLLVFVLRK